MTEVIKTKRLVLRRFRSGDAGDLVALLNDFEVVRWLTRVPYPYDLAHAHVFIDSIAEQSADAFAVCKDANIVGTVSTGETLGYWIGQPFWGNGYATEAARAMIRRFFAHRDENLSSCYHIGNARSCAVLTKLGFQPTDRQKAFSLSMGREVTMQDMTLTRSHWKAIQ